MIDFQAFQNEYRYLSASVSDIGYSVYLDDSNGFYKAVLSPVCIGLYPVISITAISEILKCGYEFRSVYYQDGKLCAEFVKYMK